MEVLCSSLFCYVFFCVLPSCSFAILLQGRKLVALNKTNTSDTEAAFLDLHLSISNEFVSTKIYDKL